jgi:hypothetical protein
MPFALLRRAHAVLFAALLTALACAHKAAAEPAALVVELFTSQGCSSCPPADALLGRLVKQAGVLALSFHVDYWNYLGWVDPFSSKKSTYRQKDYAMALRQSGVYTPQMIIQGAQGAIGSDPRAVELAVASARARPLPVPVRLAALDGRRLRVNTDAAPAATGADLWLALFDRLQTTRIMRGENEGKTLTYHHVVRELRNVGRHSGGALDLAVPATGEKGEKFAGAAILVQQPKGGPILGAAHLFFPD